MFVKLGFRGIILLDLTPRRVADSDDGFDRTIEPAGRMPEKTSMRARLESLLSHRLTKTLGILLGAGLLTFLFHAVEATYLRDLFHDLRLTWDPRPFTSAHFRTSILPPHEVYFTADEIAGFIRDLETASPRFIVWTPSSLRMPPDPGEARKVLERLTADPKVFLASQEDVRESWLAGYDGHPVFGGFPRRISFAPAGSAGQRARRIMLNFKRTGVLEEAALAVRKLGFPFDIEKITDHYDNMNTTQIFLKFYGRRAFGDHVPAAVAASPELREDYRDKIVIVGDFDERGNPIDSVYRSLYSNSRDGYASGHFLSVAHFVATYLENIVSLDYVRMPVPAVDFGFAFVTTALFLALIVFLPATTAAALSIPAIALMLLAGFLIYFLTDFYVDLSRPFLAMITVQYFGLPVLLIRYIRTRDREAAERARAEEARALKGRVVAKSARADLGLKIALQVAHDIRSPLSAINSVAFAARDVLPERGRELLRDSVGRINAVANELLERYRGGLVRQDDISDLTELGPLASAINEGFRETWPRIEFAVELPPAPVFVPVPKLTLERALANVIGNAIEAVLAGGGSRVETRVAASAAGFVMDVIDDGPGVPAEFRSRLFSEGATHGKSGGTGLGLFQTREALRKLGGDLVLRDAPRGAWFQFRLPSAEQKLEFKVQRRVVLVEDADDAREAWTRLLRHAGAEVQAFADPARALAAIETLRAAKTPFSLITDLIFQGSELTGFDIGAAAPEGTLKVLCTSLAESEEIQTLAREQGLRVLPKTALARARVILD